MVTRDKNGRFIRGSVPVNQRDKKTGRFLCLTGDDILIAVIVERLKTEGY